MTDAEIAEVVADVMQMARSREKLLAAQRHLTLALGDISGILDADPQLFPEMGALLEHLAEAGEIVRRADIVVEGRFCARYGVPQDHERKDQDGTGGTEDEG